MDGDGTGGILTLEGTVNDDHIWTALFVECKGKADTSGTCAYDEDLSEMRQRHWTGMMEESEVTSWEEQWMWRSLSTHVAAGIGCKAPKIPGHVSRMGHGITSTVDDAVSGYGMAGWRFVRQEEASVEWQDIEPVSLGDARRGHCHGFGWYP